MAQCQNFFDDKSPRIICKSSSSSGDGEQQLSPPAEGSAEAEFRHLQLRLGPSVDAQSKPTHQEMLRPIPRYPSLDKQRSGSHGDAAAAAAGSAPLVRMRSDSFLGEKAFFSNSSAFFKPPLACHSLKNSSNSVLGLDPSTACAADLGPPLVCRRSASMQSLVLPLKEMIEPVVCPFIRRTCSSSIPAGMLSRQSSFGQESLVDESPDPANHVAHQQQLDALELQKKKELQARRRLEARKRRRLNLEKQQKKARQCDIPINTQSVSSVDRASLTRTYSLGKKYCLEKKPQSEIIAAKFADSEMKVGSLPGRDADNRIKPSFLHQDTDDGRVSHGLAGKGHETVSPSRGIQGTLSNVRQMIASCDLSGDSGSKAVSECQALGRNAEMSHGSKLLRGSCSSETDSTETKEKEMYASERESSRSSSQKSSTENLACCSLLTAITSPSSKSMLCMQTSPGASSVNSKARIKPSQKRASYFPPKGNENERLHALQASCHLATELPSTFSIKKSVGVFSEGKWRTPDEDANYQPLRRTASNINEAVLEQLCMSRRLEVYASLSASQRKFAGQVVNNNLSPSLQNTQMQLHRSNELPLSRKEDDMGTSADMFSSHIAPLVKVKEEQDMMDTEMNDYDAIANPPWQAAVKMESESIKRQISASFSELPWVTTTGSGPNGLTINGVMYITGGRSVRIVCRCHGRHMSPAEFVEHAGGTDLSNPLRNIVINSLPVANHSINTRV